MFTLMWPHLLRSLSLSWSLYSNPGPCPGPCEWSPCPGPWHPSPGPCWKVLLTSLSVSDVIKAKMPTPQPSSQTPRPWSIRHKFTPVRLTTWHSGVFRISVRRGRGAVGCGGGAPPQKKSLCPQNDKFGCTFAAVFTGRKHRYVSQSLEALRHRFDGNSIAKRSLQKQCINYPKLTMGPGGGGCTTAPPTPHRIRHWPDRIGN